MMNLLYDKGVTQFVYYWVFLTKLSFIWRAYAACHEMTVVSHWRFQHDNHLMNASADVSNSKFTITMFKCWILIKSMLGDMDFNLHWPVPSMNRLNRTKHFAILLFRTSLRGFNCSVFNQLAMLTSCRLYIYLHCNSVIKHYRSLKTYRARNSYPK